MSFKSKHSVFYTAGLLAISILPIMVACNAITGVDDLRLKNTDDGETGSSGNTTSGNTSGILSGSSTTSTSSSSGVMPQLAEAGGVNITEIALYQGVKRPLMQNGSKAVSDIPVVAGRDALIRVWVSLDASYNKLPVTGQLFIGSSTTPIEVKKTLIESTEDNLDSTINFEVPGGELKGATTYRIELKQEPGAPAATGGQKYPASGAELLDVQSNGPSLKLVIVPIEYNGDGSGRLPDTTAGQIQAYKDLFYSVYPAAAVDLTVRPNPYPINYPVPPTDFNAWPQLLDEITNLRLQDGTPDDTYYYGIFNGAASEGQYCQQGCILGLGNLPGPSETNMRASIGVGFSGNVSVTTSIHETGHAHGRMHADCGGAQGIDPDSYPGADIVTWGYDLLTKQLIDPNGMHKDFMGYCEPYWLSDYSFIGLFERMKVSNGAKINIPPELMNRSYFRARVNHDGSMKWLEPMTWKYPPSGHETKTVVLETGKGQVTVTGQWYPYDHIEGGIIVWPASSEPVKSVELQVKGINRKLILSGVAK